MKTTMLFAMLFVIVGSFCVGQELKAEKYGVFSISNCTSVTLPFQIRGKNNQKNEWTKWEEYKCLPGKGRIFYYPSPNFWNWEVQIRFDRIAGDKVYTEKIYDLGEFKYPRKEKKEEKGFKTSDGWKYYFEFDAGGRLLDLKKVPGRRAPK